MVCILSTPQFRSGKGPRGTPVRFAPVVSWAFTVSCDVPAAEVVSVVVMDEVVGGSRTARLLVVATYALFVAALASTSCGE